MSDFFDQINNNFNKELIPYVLKYLKDPNNKLVDNLNKLINDPKNSLNEILDGFSNNKKNTSKNKSYIDIQNIPESFIDDDNDYEKLLSRLKIIEENMNLIKYHLKDQ